MDCTSIARAGALAVAVAATGLAPNAVTAAEDDVLVQIHFQPVPNAQIAIWLEDEDGNFVQDVMVTQATGSLGIGNRPGRRDFLSSWRFPYGPRTGVLPVWAHARGKTYPQLVFHDDDVADQDSLGWHENTSSPEPYFCRPLAEAEHQTISTDTMTCPSPATFQSDKGRFEAGVTSVYPPRNDLTTFEDGHDSADVPMLSMLNDLDAVTSATPQGVDNEVVNLVLPAAVAHDGPYVIKLEINLERDENPDWDFDRETDHYVDPRLPGFGIEYFGQPSVVYALPFDPLQQRFVGTDAYLGYGEFDGSSGEVYPPDNSISTEGGSGADRLSLYTLNDETFRLGVYSYGPDAGPEPEPPGPGEPPDDNPWGRCELADLPPLSTVELEPMDFDTVRVHFTVPDLTYMREVDSVRLYYRQGEAGLTDENVGSAIQQIPLPEHCSGDIVPGEPAWCDVTELFGNYDYQVGVAYEDDCGNLSGIAAASVRTPAQEFAQVEGFCFVATAAYGAPWASRVQALRWFRDLYLRTNPMGRAFVSFYYAHSPPLAQLIAKHPLPRGIARAMLAPVANLAVTVTDPGR